MALRTPILDDRSYAQLRDELVARIPVYVPEWTDHHPSDPGVTLLELFAFLGENLLFRFNQIPDATRLAFSTCSTSRSCRRNRRPASSRRRPASSPGRCFPSARSCSQARPRSPRSMR